MAAFFRILSTALFLSVASLSADDVLFIGNSFTYGGKPLREHGGVPRIVETIAKAKGKDINTLLIATGGKTWDYHLAQEKTQKALREKWDWIVLQDNSSRPTRVGNLEGFFNDGKTFAKLIREHSPETGIILYETWARSPGHSFYLPTENEKPKFRDPAEMLSELQSAYGKLQKEIKSTYPHAETRVAPVGQAFALCQQRHPEINLYSKDLYHADPLGSYLAALVIYATIYQDDPTGGPLEFEGFSVDADTAAKLQAIAREIALGKS